MSRKREPQAPVEPRPIEQVRRDRNRVLGISLAAFVILVFFISIAKFT